MVFTAGQLEPTNWTLVTNEKLNDTESLLELNHQVVRKLAPVIAYLILLMVIGIPGNSVTCYIYLKKMKKTTANGFILCLAVLDLSTCVLGIPFDICDILMAYLFDQPVVCKLFRFIIYFTVITSSATLLSIAIDRYYKVCKPLKQSPIRNVRHFIVGSVVIGLTMACPTLGLYGTADIQTPFKGILGHSCAFAQNLGTSPVTIAYVTFLLVINVMAMICLLLLYSFVGLRVRKRSRMTIGDKARPKDPKTGSAGKCLNRPRYKVYRATVLCVAVTIAFIVSFFPTLVLHAILVGIKGFEDNLSGASFVAYTFFLRSFFLTNAINPVIYGCINPVFRRECILLLKRMKPCGKSQENTNAAVWYIQEED